MQKKKEIIIAFILTALMAFIEMSALPMALFCNIEFKDIEPIYFALMLNFLLAFAICFLFRKFLIKDWNFGLKSDGILTGLKNHGLPALIATVLATVAFCIGLMPFDNKPTVWRVIIEGVVYYIGVGIMEELYLRGLLQNAIEKLLGDKKNATLYAILIASLLFGLGHIFGALGQPILVVTAKTVWATALGVYFGAVYAKTRNLWVPVILHFIVDIGAIPVCFSTSNPYSPIVVITLLLSYLLLGIYGVYIIKKEQ